MNWVSDRSVIGCRLLEDQVLDHLQKEVDLFLTRDIDRSKARFLEAFFKSLLGILKERVYQFYRLDEEDVSRLASRHLYHNTMCEIQGGITCLNEAISHLNAAGTIAIPPIEASKIIVKHTRQQAVTIDQNRLASYLKVERLYDFFLNHFDVQNNEEDLAFAAVFSMIVNGCHFHKSYLSIIDVSVFDFNPTYYWIELEKKHRKKRDKQQVKIRFFLSAISVIYLLRMIKLASGRINSFSDGLFPQSFLVRKPTGHEFVGKFRRWLDRLISAFNKYNDKQSLQSQNEYNDEQGLRSQNEIVIQSITLKELYQGSQIWTGLRYPFFETSYLTQKMVPGQLSSANYRTFFTKDRVQYTGDINNSPKKRSWLRVQNFDFSDPDKEVAEDVYLNLMNVHSAVIDLLKNVQGNLSKKEKDRIVPEIGKMTQLLPLSTLSQVENGYLSNYKQLLNWLVVIVQRKKVETAVAYFSDLANMLFFGLADTCLISLDQYELADLVFELIHSSNSPRTQRNTKNKLRQFLSFLSSGNLLPKLDWNHPDFWIFDEPVEREIMGFTEFDTVCDQIENSVAPEHVDTLKAVLIILFYAGLRIHEAALLSHDAVYVDLELNILIKKSKTRAGKRALPLHYLVPDKELNFLRDFVIKRRPKGPKLGVPLFSLDGVTFPDPEVLASMITSIIYGALKRNITCHQLRHSFASWLLVRWYALLYGKKTLKPFFVDSSHPAFYPDELKKLRELFLGVGPERVGEEYFMHAIICISRLLGHAGPITTVNVYTHTIDVLYRMFLVERDEMSLFSISRAARIMGVSYPTAKGLAGSDKRVTLSAMVKYCLKSYELPGIRV